MRRYFRTSNNGSTTTTTYSTCTAVHCTLLIVLKVLSKVLYVYVYNVVQLYTYNVTFVLIRTFVNFRTGVRVRVHVQYTYFRTFSTFVRKFSYFRTFVIEDFVKCHVADLHVRTVEYFRMILTT